MKDVQVKLHTLRSQLQNVSWRIKMKCAAALLPLKIHRSTGETRVKRVARAERLFTLAAMF